MTALITSETKRRNPTETAIENECNRSTTNDVMTPRSGFALMSQILFSADCSSPKTAVAPIMSVTIPTLTAQSPLPNPRDDSITCRTAFAPSTPIIFSISPTI